MSSGSPEASGCPSRVPRHCETAVAPATQLNDALTAWPGAYGPTGARMTICGGAGTLEGVVVKLEPLLALYATFTPSVASTNTSGFAEPAGPVQSVGSPVPAVSTTGVHVPLAPTRAVTFLMVPESSVTRT